MSDSTGAGALATLLSPIEIGSVRLENRVVMLPMGLKFTTDGAPTAHDVAFVRARAEGGVAMVVMGGTIVHETGQLRPRFFSEAYRPEHVERFAAVADAAHGGGAKMLGQLFHCGREVLGDYQLPLWAPSPLASAGGRQVPHEMTLGEIAEIVEGFARSAANLQQAGFDGVELHGAHGYLIDQFLSQDANHRTDAYGGDSTGRMRFLLEIVEAIRDRCGRRFVLGVRMSADDEVDGGIGLDEATVTARTLGATGQVDYLSVAIGHRGTYVKDMGHGFGLAARHAAAIRAVAGVPVLAAQRITHPTLAEEILASGAADLVGMGRALIADPAWVAKARAGQADRILPCVGCVQDCRSHAAGAGISCVHNPASGRELRWGPLPAIDRRRRIAVVGGGPAGLEAARVAATRGHDVVLIEREAALGGQLRLATRAPGRVELDGVVTFRAEELARLGVDVRLGVDAEPEVVAALHPDVVIVASGARAAGPAISGDQVTAVRSAWAVLADPDREAAGVSTALVFDAGDGGWEAFCVAEVLAGRGVAVSMAAREAQVGARLPHESRGPWLRRLGSHCTAMLAGCELVSVGGGTARLWDAELTVMRAEPVEHECKVDLVVECGRRVADDQGWATAAVPGARIVLVGDCLAPRDLSHAVHDGHLAARQA